MNELTDVPILGLSDEVAEALATASPIVALESTLLAHGLPKPSRAEVALALEGLCRARGAVPATIAIVDGRLQVGLNDSTLARLVDGGARKASLRDLAPAIALGGVWATTVAATMAIAHRAGIRWFATGGIGGVHRGAAASFDESADLMALAQYPVGVVCSGAKSVLDLPKTLERLETLGVPVLGFQTDAFPAFYHAESGLSVSCRVNSSEEAARVGIARFDRLQSGGLLLCQPPPESLSLPVMETLVQEGLAQAQARGIVGSEVTPFLLSHLHAATEGDSVRVNVALVKQNCELAADIAVADSALR